MITQKGNFKEGVINFLLFSSMLNPAEMYLSRETKKISKSGNLKGSITGIVTNTLSLFRKKTKESSLDHGIEAAMNNIKDSEQENSNLLAKMLDYNSEEKKPMDVVKSALKKLYNTFVSYAKGAYTKASDSVSYTKRKIIEGPVRITTEKFCKISQYVLAALSPQWNMPMLSKMDFDTLAPAITNHIIDEDYSKKISGYMQ